MISLIPRMFHGEVSLNAGHHLMLLYLREKEELNNKMGLSVEMKTFKGVKPKNKQSLSHTLRRGPFKRGFR